ncbi:MAG: winged helix-turn-helix domain-containing protein [Actinobacteria bacterium]|nr:winged helix-turn-helix domain-containing protein [Actinomycetota bacterium]
MLTLAKVPIVAAKLRPPSLPARILFTPRHRVLAEKILNRRLTAIIAPAGYGKTTFLSCLAHLIKQGDFSELKADPGDGSPEYRLAWYTIGPMDADPAIFLAHLIGALEVASPGIGDQASRVLSSVTDVNRDGHLVAAALCEELWSQEEANPPQGVLVVLDDYHLVAEVPAIAAAVQFQVANFPAAYHLCLAGREKPPLSTGRLALNDQYLEIEPRDIAFSEEEMKSYLNNVCGLGLDDRQIGELAAVTEGWPAGLVLATQAISLVPRTEVKKTLASFSGKQEAIFAFFSGEVLSRLNEETRRFLMAAANLSYLTPEACASVLGVDRAEEKLEALRQRGLFLTVTQAGDERVYRFHRLFQDALAVAQKRYLESDPLRDLHRRAAEYYEAGGQMDAAMEHLLAAGDAPSAAALLCRRGQQIIDRGYVDQLRYWLRALPGELIDRDPLLLYFKGFVHQHSDQAVALDCLDRAARGLAERGELHLEVRALIYMATIYSLQNRVDKVKETAARIPALKAMTRDRWARGVLVVSSMCQAAWDDSLRRGVWLGRLARLLPLDDDWRWAMLAYSCMIYYRLGDLKMARLVIEEALEMEVVRNNDVWLGMALTLYRVVLYCEDDVAMGEKVGNRLWELGERYDSAYYKAYAQRAMAFPPRMRGGLDEAREMLLSSLYFFERAGNGAMASITRLDLAVLEAEAGRASEVLSDAIQAFSDVLALDCGQGLAEYGQSLLGVVAREAGDLDLAEKHLLSSARISRSKGAKQILFGTYLHLAQLYIVKGMDEAADDYLKRAFDTAETAGYLVTWDWHRPTVLSTCLRALERGIHPGYAGKLLAHWFGAEAAGPLRELAPRLPEKRRPELQKLMAQLQPASDPPVPEAPATRSRSPRVNISATRIEVRLLGDFEVLVDRTRVPERNWQTRQVKKLFKYLVLGRGRKFSREHLMEFLWPEADPRAAAASLRVTLSRLRQALPEGAGGSPPIMTAPGIVWLNDSNAVSADVEQFVRLVSNGQNSLEEGHSAGAKEAFEGAIALYRGDLLPEDIYEDWTAAERERLQILYLDALTSLAQVYRKLPGNEYGYRRARDVLRKALAVDPYREEINLDLMELYVAAGQADEALHLFLKYKELINKEFGIEPGEEILRLAEKTGYRRTKSSRAQRS